MDSDSIGCLGVVLFLIGYLLTVAIKETIYPTEYKTVIRQVCDTTKVITISKECVDSIYKIECKDYRQKIKVN